MVRQANVYFEEGSIENAYLLYMRFMTLFLEKIRKHPDFGNVPATTKVSNQAKVREVLPKAEKLKTQLLELYKQEYKQYVAEEVRVRLCFSYVLLFGSWWLQSTKNKLTVYN